MEHELIDELINIDYPEHELIDELINIDNMEHELIDIDYQERLAAKLRADEEEAAALLPLIEAERRRVPLEDRVGHVETTLIDVLALL